MPHKTTVSLTCENSASPFREYARLVCDVVDNMPDISREIEWSSAHVCMCSIFFELGRVSKSREQRIDTAQRCRALWDRRGLPSRRTRMLRRTAHRGDNFAHHPPELPRSPERLAPSDPRPDKVWKVLIISVERSGLCTQAAAFCFVSHVGTPQRRTGNNPVDTPLRWGGRHTNETIAPSSEDHSSVPISSPTIPVQTSPLAAGMSEIELSSPLNYGTPSSLASIRTPRSGIRGTPIRHRPDVRSDRRTQQVNLAEPVSWNAICLLCNITEIINV